MSSLKDDDGAGEFVIRLRDEGLQTDEWCEDNREREGICWVCTVEI